MPSEDKHKTKKIRFKTGDVFIIPLGPGQGYGYCRYLDHLVTEFIELHSQKPLPIEDIVNAKAAFVVWVSKEPFTSGAWRKIGHCDVANQSTPLFFRQDPISKNLFLYQNGRETPAKLAECESLENAAVWSAGHIEDRLRDHFAGRPNKWVESLKAKVPSR